MHLLKRRIILGGIGLLSLSSFSSYANESNQSNREIETTLSIDFRPRAEVRHGAFLPIPVNQDPAFFVSNRVRPVLQSKIGNSLELKVAPQMISVWGQTGTTQGVAQDANIFGLHEAWVKLNMSPSWSAVVGRQEIALDDERIFGALDWAQGGRAHDALSFQFEKRGFELKSYFSYNSNKEAFSDNYYQATPGAPHRAMQSVWAKLPVNDEHYFSALATNLSFSNGAYTLRFEQILGFNYFYNGKTVNTHLGAYYQGGRTAQDLKLRAMSATASVKVKLDSHWTLGLGSDMITGDDMDANLTIDKITNQFIPYFATGHKFYGAMDYYYAGAYHSGIGLSDSYFQLSFNHKKFSIAAVLHQFYGLNRIINAQGKVMESNLGQELDWTLNYKINKYSQLFLGYSTYFTTDNTMVIKHANDPHGYLNQQHWAWLSLKVNPQLFKIKTKY